MKNIKNKLCKKSWIIIIVSIILAVAVFALGMGVEFSGGSDKILAESKVTKLTLGSTEYNDNSPAVFKFTPSFTGNYKISISYPSKSYYVYILDENSQTLIYEGDYTRIYLSAGSAQTYLRADYTYYLVIYNDSGENLGMNIIRVY